MKSSIYIYFFLYLILSCYLFHIESAKNDEISNERSCADPECSVPISSGLAQILYHTNSKHGVSLKRGSKVTVFSKEAGTRKDLWGVEVEGRRGYVPKSMITEKKIFVEHSNVKYTVPTEPYLKDRKLEAAVEKIEESLSVFEDSLIDNNAKEVLKSFNEPNHYSSFLLPGSVAENTVSPDIKDKIDPEKVKYVVEGTTLFNVKPNDVTYSNYPGTDDNSPKTTESKETDEKIEEKLENETDLRLEPKKDNFLVKSSADEVASVPKDDLVSSPVNLKKLVANLNEEKQHIHEKSSDAFSDKLIEEKEADQVTKSDVVSNNDPTTVESDDGVDEDGEIDEDEDEDDEEEGEEAEEEEADEGGDEKQEKELNISTVEEKSIAEKSVPSDVPNEIFQDAETFTNDSLSSVKEDKIVSVQEKKENYQLHQQKESKDQPVQLHIKSDVSESTRNLINPTDPTAKRFDHTSTEIKPEDESQDKKKSAVAAEESTNQSAKQQIFSDISESSVNVTDVIHESSKSLDNPSSEISSDTDKKSESGLSDNVEDIAQKLESESGNVTYEQQMLPMLPNSDVGKYNDGETFNNISNLLNSNETGKLSDKAVEQQNSDKLFNETEKVLSQSSEFESGLTIHPSKNREDTINETEESSTVAAFNINEELIVNTSKIPDTPPSNDKVYEETTSQPVEEAKEPTLVLTPDDNSEVKFIEKTVEEPIKVSTEDYSGSPQLPLLSILHPPIQNQLEISGQKTQSESPTMNFDAEQQTPEKESLPVEDGTIPKEETELSDDVESEPWFNFDFITNLFSSSSSTGPETVEVFDSEETSLDPGNSMWNEKSHFTHDEETLCLNNDGGENSCRQFENAREDNLLAAEDKEVSWDVIKDLLSASHSVTYSTNSLIYLFFTAISVIVFSLGYYYLENRRNDRILITKINKLERDLLVVKKEAAMFQAKLQTAESQVTFSHDSLSEFEEKIAALTEELEETKTAKAELEEQCATLEKEFDAATESGLEMHRLLTETISSQDGSQFLFKTVESLREKLNLQEGEIKDLKQLLREKSEEIEKLNEEMKINQEARKSVQEKLTNLRQEKEEEVLRLKDSNRILSTQFGDLMEEKSLIEMKLTNDVSNLRLLVEETQTALADREGEIDALKEAISKLNNKDENLDALYDTAKVSSKLAISEKERDNYKEKFLEEEGARKLLEDHVQMTRQEVKSLKENYETAEKEKIEALTKLQVLSNYFKEKESELQKELGTQESLWLQKQSDDHTIYEQMKSLREENEKYKLQNESLKKEICESESAFKIQIANVEQKAHDHWLNTRQLERRLKETQNEATQLRNRLTLVEKNATNSSSDDLKQNMSYGIGETNGDPSSPPPTMPLFPPTTSPPFMMFGGGIPPPPPPNSEFLPPPPPPLGFPEGRPAPVGRISSPPLDHSFSPPPPLPYFYEPSSVFGGHHSPSPPPHRPMPKSIREMGMEQKDRVSPSRHSEQQDRERIGRRSKR